MRFNFIHTTLFSLLLSLSFTAFAETKLLNVSYDVAREFYKDYNQAFVKYWKNKTGETISIQQSHGGSSKQARAVVDGLEADVITMNQANDIDILAEKQLIPADWQKRLAHNSAPTTSTTVFLVRKGNPKKIQDWEDLAKPGVAVIIPNPKTSGNGRYSYLSAWAYITKKGGNEQQAKEFVTKVFKNVPVLDTGGRAATTTFIQRNIGDVLLTFENEVELIRTELGNPDFDVVYPSNSILVENPVAVVDKYADKHGTKTVAQAYLEYLYSEEGQEIAVKHHLRPRLAKIAEKNSAKFPKLKSFTVDDVFGGWQQAQKIHFHDGGIFDQIYVPGK